MDNRFDKYIVNKNNDYEKYAVNPIVGALNKQDFFDKYIKSEPFGLLRDIGAAGLRAGQNIAATLGEAGQAIGDLASPLRRFVPESMKFAPYVNIREELGLGKDRPIDVGSLVQGNNPNPLTQGITQYAGGAILGGPSMGGQIAGNAIWGALQSQPDQSNLSGLLPNGRLGAAIEEGGLAALSFLGAKAISGLKSSSKTGLKNTILKSHDAIESSADKGFNHVSNEVKQRNVTFPEIPNLANELKEYFPKTKTAEKMLKKAEYGDYDSLRKVQEDLYTTGKLNKKSDLESDRLRGEERFEKRNEINKMISDNLKNTGNEDLAKALDKARNEWRILHEVYYNPKMPTALIKMVDKTHRLIPKDIFNILSEDSIPMNQLKEFHPGLSEAVSRYGNIKNINKRISKLAPWAGGATIGALTTKFMKK